MNWLLWHTMRSSRERPYLPSLVCSAVVGVVFGDVGVDATESQLFVLCWRDGLDDQLCVGIRWLGLILDTGDTNITIQTSFIYTSNSLKATNDFSLEAVHSDVTGSSPWGCLHQPIPPAAPRRRPLSAQQCFVFVQKQPWQRIQLLTGGQRSRCVHSDDTLMTLLLED